MSPACAVCQGDSCGGLAFHTRLLSVPGDAIRQYGITPYHRKTFNMLGDGQLSLNFED